MKPVDSRRYPNFTLLRYKLAPNEPWTITTTGKEPTSFASYLLDGGRLAVEHPESGDDWADGTWHLPNPERLYITRYRVGTHTMVAGPSGMDFLCFLKVAPRPPKLTRIEIDGDFTVPAGIALFICDGRVTDGERMLEDLDYLAPAESDTRVNGVCDALLVDGPVL